MNGKIQILQRERSKAFGGKRHGKRHFFNQTKWKTECLMILMSICFVLRGWTCGYFVEVDSTKMYQNEVSPKFNCCKMEYLLILRFKGPLRFSMFRTRLSRKRAWPCVFLNGLRDFNCRAPFWRPCTFACVPAKFFQSVFVAPLQHGHSSRGGSACMFLRMDGQCF